jgi:proline iminopeptidase
MSFIIQPRRNPDVSRNFKRKDIMTHSSQRIGRCRNAGSVYVWRSLALALLLLFAVHGCTHTSPFKDARGNVIPGSIATMESVTIGGISQGIWFRGRDTENPAVILLHGGPGISESALYRHYDAELETHFLMVYWDQRGAGGSYHTDIARDTMTIGQFERDLDAVIELVRRRFCKRKVILLAHSWGTVLGTLYAYTHPDKVAAYVGIGQIADFAADERRSYEWTLAQAVSRGNQRAVGELRAMYPKPRSVDDELTKGKWTEAFGGKFHQDLATGKLIMAALSTDEASLLDIVRFGQGNHFSLETLRPEYSNVDLTRYRSFKVPIVFILGRYDWHIPSVLAERYFNMINAPKKRLIWFELSAHNPPFEEPQHFVRVMRDDVLPLIGQD